LSAGDKVQISGKGVNNSRLWAFLDADDKLLSNSVASLTLFDYELTAPANTAKVVINSNVSGFSGTKVIISKAGNIVESALDEIRQKRINILVIGNSFSHSSLAETGASILDLCRNAKCDAYIEIVGAGGASFSTLYTSFVNDTSLAYHWYGDTHTGWYTLNGDDIKISDVLPAKNWDYIVFHQASANSGDYSTFSPDLANLIRVAKLNCKNEQMKIGLMLTWAYANNAGTYPNATTGFDTQTEFYEAICDAYKDAMVDFGADILIPAGTALQNARGTSLDTAFSDFAASASDAVHINAEGGVITALTWFASTFGRRYNIPLNTINKFTTLYTDAQYEIALECAKNAILLPYEQEIPQ
jgi:hypothetical protein